MSFTFVDITHATIGVADASTELAPKNINRTYMLFINDSDAVVYVKRGTAVVGEGIRLAPNGGAYEMTQKDGNLDTDAWSAIHAGQGEKNVLITYGSNV